MSNPVQQPRNGSWTVNQDAIDYDKIVDKLAKLVPNRQSEESEAFALLQRRANMVSQSSMIPKEFQGNIPNCAIALDIADRLQANYLTVMQSLYVVNGKPSWASTFVIGTINASGRFGSLRFRMTKIGKKTVSYDVWSGYKENRTKTTKTIQIDDVECVAYARDTSGELLESPPVSIEMAVKEGWYTKEGSKWVTMPELMLRYRPATLFGRLFCPELLMGLRTVEETHDIEEEVKPSGNGSNAWASVAAQMPAKEEKVPETKPDGEIVEEAANNTTFDQDLFDDYMADVGRCVSAEDLGDIKKYVEKNQLLIAPKNRETLNAAIEEKAKTFKKK